MENRNIREWVLLAPAFELQESYYPKIEPALLGR
jgi:hypothetical protein